MSSDPELPVACNLDAADGAARMQRWRALVERSQPRVSRSAHELELSWRLDAEGRDELYELVASERECCAFVTWSLAARGADTILTIAADPGQAEDLDAIAALLPFG